MVERGPLGEDVKHLTVSIVIVAARGRLRQSAPGEREPHSSGARRDGAPGL
ncbi:MAG: hypothetical protein LPK04_07005 [Caulobacteraceae bacterium]|nr:hypothetical protein [Caulobacteraceae bacterium]